MNLAFLSSTALPLTRFRSHITSTHTTCCTTSSTSAGLLNSDGTSDSRFVDLRTIKTARWENTFVSKDSSQEQSTENMSADRELRQVNEYPRFDEDILFTRETLPLSEPEKSAVHALLSGNSVLFYANASETLKAFVVDLALRAKVWKQSVVYCASSSRAAQVFYSALSVQFTQSYEVLLDIGIPSKGDSAVSTKYASEPPSLIITVSEVVTRRLMSGPKQSFVSDASIFAFDSFIHNDTAWEELILSVPSSAVTCLIVRNVDIGIGEHILTWIHSVVGPVVPVFSNLAPQSPQRKVECLSASTIRTFVYNAATHSSPIEVSLPLLNELALRRKDQHSIDFADALLRDVEVLEAENPENLLFRSHIEAEYADIVSLLLHDATRTGQNTRPKPRRKASAKKNRTPSSLSAARKRRDSIFRESRIFPVIVIVQSKLGAVSTAEALINSSNDSNVFLWDEGSRDHLHDVLKAFVQEHDKEIDEDEHVNISYLARGIGVIHNGTLPALKLLAVELFRSSLISILVIDSFLGPDEIHALPASSTVIIHSSALAEVNDAEKGLVSGPTASSLIGGITPGNLIVTWYDEAVSDSDATAEVYESLSRSHIVRKSSAVQVSSVQPLNNKDGNANAFLDKLLGLHRLRASHGVMWSSYAGVLRVLRKFGLTGAKAVTRNTADFYQALMAGAIIKATREKLDVEINAIENRLENVDWNEVAEHDRIVAEEQSYARLLKSAQECKKSLLAEHTTDALKLCRPGTIIGLRFVKDSKGYPYSRQCVQLTIASTPKEILPAVFVSLLENSVQNPLRWSSDVSHLVVCILPDGSWCYLPCTDVLVVAEKESPFVGGVELMDVPHLATFDIDPVSCWGKCRALSETEDADIGRISDQLCRVVYPLSEEIKFQAGPPELDLMGSSENASQSLVKRSPWHGREEELQVLRSLRKRAAELRENESMLRDTGRKLDEVIDYVQEVRKSLQARTLAVLEDCNAIRIYGGAEMEMTPIGALASLLPGAFPLFTASCLLLVNDISDFTGPQLCAFIALIMNTKHSSTKKMWNDLDNEEDSKGGGDVENLVPVPALNAVKEIMRAFHVLQERHSSVKPNENQAIYNFDDTAPSELNEQYARLVYEFASGTPWVQVFRQRADRTEDMTQIRKVAQTLSVMKDGGAIDEFPGDIREVAAVALQSLMRWPVCDNWDLDMLVKEGVVTKSWTHQSYERWWKTVNSALSR